MPILDVKVWPEVRKEDDGSLSSKIVHEFYSKEISSKAVTHANSAMSMRSKEHTDLRDAKSPSEVQPAPRLVNNNNTRQ